MFEVLSAGFTHTSMQANSLNVALFEISTNILSKGLAHAKRHTSLLSLIYIPTLTFSFFGPA